MPMGRNFGLLSVCHPTQICLLKCVEDRNPNPDTTLLTVYLNMSNSLKMVLAGQMVDDGL